MDGQRFAASWGTLVLLGGMIAGCSSTESLEKRVMPAPEPRVLNNFVTELLQTPSAASVEPGSYEFTNPRDGWVFLRTTAETAPGGVVEVSLGGPQGRTSVIRHEVGKPDAGCR